MAKRRLHRSEVLTGADGSLRSPGQIATPAGMAAAALSLLASFPSGALHAQDPPPLTVVLVVDQMPIHLLERYDDRFEGGLRRLLDRGAVLTRARHRHGIPHTAPGHATLSTGQHPSTHGIVSNNWPDRSTGRWIYAVGDSTAPLVGGDGPGRSPARLESPTLGTLLKAARPGARVVSVAPKDRSAILMGGRDADGAYWFDARTGRWITSSWYRSELPDWVDAFNASGLADSLAGTPWTPLGDDSVEFRSREDDAPYENSGENTTFPHDATRPQSGSGWAPRFRWTPWLDEVTLELARAAITALDLGGDDVPDLLWVGLSASDFIGHAFGPWSREVEDNVRRLDRALGAFFRDLDRRLGAEGYAVALSADHGVVPMPEWAASRGNDARRLDAADVAGLLRPAVDRAAAAEGADGPVDASLAYLGVYLRFPPGLPEPAVRRVTAEAAEAVAAHPRISDAFTDAELAAGSARPFADAFRRSRFPGRSPDIFLLGREHDLMAGPGITAHLSPYDHDVRVPMIVMASGIVAGRYGPDVGTADLAPTLARLLGLSGEGFGGRVLTEVLR